MVCNHTPEEHETFLSNYRNRGESITFIIEPETPPLSPGPLEYIAARYASQGSTITAEKIREAANHGGEVLVYRSLRSFGPGFTTEAIPLCGENARDAWDDILKSDCNAYDRPRIYRGMLGPFAL
jgi:hypothetical protein